MLYILPIPMGGIGIDMGGSGQKLFDAFVSLGRRPVALVVSAIALFVSYLTDLAVDPAWVAVVLCGLPIMLEAAEAVIRRRDIKADLLVSLAMIASVSIGEVFAAGTVAIIMQVGGYLEDRTVAKANRGVERLVRLRPTAAHVLRDGQWTDVDISDVKAGDTVRVLAGETVPVDGRVLSGKAAIDQSVMTGESLPVDKAEGDQVMSGTVVSFGAFEMVAEKVGEDASIRRMIRLIQSADPGTAKIVRAADRWATWIVVAALSAAALTYVFTMDPYRAVTILVVFCPCSFVLATPTAVVAAIGNAARHGVLIRRGDALERMASVDDVLFDKTGTLTEGRMRVEAVKAVNGMDEGLLLRLAASAESMSEHPIGKAIAAGYSERSGQAVPSPSSFDMAPGLGVSAEVEGRRVDVGNGRWMKALDIDALDVSGIALNGSREGYTSVYAAVDGTIAGVILLADAVRPESRGVVSNIRSAGAQSIILTGDSEGAAARVTAEVGADDCVYRCLPEDKLRIVRNIETGGARVCMVGDGVNDAAALKAAHVGVSMGLGSDIAVESSDVVMSRGDLASMPHVLALSKRTLKTIHFNLAVAMGINVVALVLAVLGLIGPISGAVIHNAGSVAVMLTSATLLFWRSGLEADGPSAEKAPASS